MRDSEAAIEPAFYDHEHEQTRDRERRADDWGGDEVFATVPRRRFGRRGAHASAGEMTIPRRASGPARPRDGAPFDPRPRPGERLEKRPAAGSDIPPRDELVAGVDFRDPVELRAADREQAVAERAAAASVAQPGPAAPAAEPAIAGYTPEPEPTGRRTVVVTGRPGPVAGITPRVTASGPERRRPPKRVHERVGPRPDRVAGWAFGLGMLLIAVAVGTADAAPL